MGRFWASALLLCVLIACQSNKPVPLYDRMGGDVMISAIVDDFMDRAMGDSRVNFTRAGTSAEWHATTDNVLAVRTHLIEFVESASGGPVDYEGRDMKSAHAGMHITDQEFDAAEQDFKESMEKFDVPVNEMGEMMRVIEGTRKDIVGQ